MKTDLNLLRNKYEQYLRGCIRLDELVTFLSHNELDCALLGMKDCHPSVEFAAMNVPIVTWRVKP